jgi:hypothetical protein
VITTPTFRPEAFGEGAQVAQPPGSRREVTTPEPHKVECFEERDPATGETRIVERLTYRNTYNAMSENPRAFGAGAAVLVGAYPAQVLSVSWMIDFHLRLLR